MKNNKSKITIKTRNGIILLVLILLFITLTFVVAIGTRGYRDKQIMLMRNSMDILGKNQKDHFQQFIDDKKAILEGLTQYPEIYEMNTKGQELFLKGKSEKFGFNHMFVLDDEGNGFYFDEEKITDHSKDLYYYDVMNRDFFITDPYIMVDGGIITTLSVPIYRDDMKQGALCGAVRLDSVANMFAEYDLVMDEKSFLINRRGEYIVADDEKKVMNQMSIYKEANSETTLIKEAFFDQEDKFGDMVLEGQKYTVHITYLPEFDWAIVQCIASSQFYRDIKYFDLWRNGSFIIIILIIFCVIMIVAQWHWNAAKIKIDALTKCNSRVAINNMIDNLEYEYHKDITMIFFDLNKFKQVNDTYGHDEGDRVLCIFSSILMETYKNYAEVGRLGGDEFIAIAVDKEEEKIVELAKQVNEKLQEKKKELGLPYEISTSYGYASREKGSKYMLSEIMKMADESMYRYKEEIHKQMNR